MLKRSFKIKRIKNISRFLSTVKLERIAEYNARTKFHNFIENISKEQSSLLYNQSNNSHDNSNNILNISNESLLSSIDSALMTFESHVEARLATANGYGFYTIGPCGEELLGTIGNILEPSDAVALHYRHVAISIQRQLQIGTTIENIALDRARAYTCSIKDQVTSGRHCALGGTKNDFYVTSTLATQTPPAVGRALGFGLASYCNNLSPPTVINATANDNNMDFTSNSVSFVSVGDGSTHNHHFLSATNLAQFAIHRRNVRCPVVFCITNNELSISLRTHGWAADKGPLVKRLEAMNFPVYSCNANDILSIHNAASKAINNTRKKGRPSILLVDNVVRRFGHAATDRQDAYLSDDEISQMRNHDPLQSLVTLALDRGIHTKESIQDRSKYIHNIVKDSFNIAKDEEGSGDRAYLSNVSAPLVSVKESKNTNNSTNGSNSGSSSSSSSSGSSNEWKSDDIVRVMPISPEDVTKEIQSSYHTKLEKYTTTSKAIKKRDTMRKLINAGLRESLEMNHKVVIIGEDIEHGGYYALTDNLAVEFPGRVIDFPPDETALVGAGIGFSQVGLLPIVEIPYAKYLDCAYDMFQEAIISHWITDGRQKNGMVIRLQGFDRGVFGGNYHTHNMLTIPPGLDVVVPSNGEEYVRLLRYSLKQAEVGRVVMIVEPTEILAKRHINEGDEAMLRYFPTLTTTTTHDASDISGNSQEIDIKYRHDYSNFDEVTIYTSELQLSSPPPTEKKARGRPKKTASIIKKDKHVMIVTYGNGVPLSLQAVEYLQEHQHQHQHQPSSGRRIKYSVVSHPYLTKASEGLKAILNNNIHDSSSDDNRDSDRSAVPDVVVFADMCKEGPGSPLGAIALELHNSDILKTTIATNNIESSQNNKKNSSTNIKNNHNNNNNNNNRSNETQIKWRVIGAQRTYNPLGKMTTFLSKDDIVETIIDLLD